MNQVAYKVTIHYYDKIETITVDNTTYTIGSAEDANFFLPSDVPGNKLSLIKIDDQLKIKAHDINFAILADGKKYKSANIKISTIISCGPLKLSIEKIYTEFSEEIFDELILDSEHITPMPTVTQDIPAVNTKQNIDQQVLAMQDQKVELKPEVEFEFEFNTTFDETPLSLITNVPYEDSEITFNHYIDPQDENEPEQPSEHLYKYTDKNSIYITHSNNGTVLSDQYYPMAFSSIYLSNEKSTKNCFLAHDCNFKRSCLVKRKLNSNKLNILAQDGFDFYSVSKDKQLKPIETSTFPLSPGSTVILSKGLSQILIEIRKAPPSIKRDALVEVDEKAVKIIASTWAAMFVPLFLIMLLVDIPDRFKEEKKEIGVIYKRVPAVEMKQVTPQEPTPQVSETPAAPEQKVEVNKKKEVNKKQIAKAKPPKPKPAMKVKNQKSKAIAQVSKTVQKKVQTAKPKKQYKFSALSQLANNNAGTQASIQKANTGQVKMDHFIAGADSSASQSDAKLADTSVDVNKFATKNSGAVSASKGTQGLSRKIAAATSYSVPTTKVLGAMDPELIRKILREYISQFRYCYQKALFKNPNLAGAFDLNFTIGPNGTGGNVSLKGSGKNFDPPTVNCIKKVVSLIKFPKPKGGGTVDVRQPLNFTKD